MKDNIYPYIIDCSLMKGKKENYSEMLVFELQPFILSRIGPSHWNYHNAFQKKFPNTRISINREEDVIAEIHPSKFLNHMLIKNTKIVGYSDYEKIKQGYYKYLHTVSFEREINKLDNKVYQRLYLPDEVSPEYRILDSSLSSKALTEEIFTYFTEKKSLK